MFQIVRSGTNRLDIELGGKVDGDGMKVLINELTEKSEGIEHGLMMCRLRDFNFPTFGAIGVELARLPKLFTIMRKFDRAAILADKKWIRSVSEIEGALMPGFTTKAFNLDEQLEAETWLNAPPGARH